VAIRPYQAQANVLDVHPLAREWLHDVLVPVVLTEGVIKADSAVSVGLAAIGLGGADGGWRNGRPHPVSASSRVTSPPSRSSASFAPRSIHARRRCPSSAPVS
jgi:hypothetical protein